MHFDDTLNTQKSTTFLKLIEKEKKQKKTRPSCSKLQSPEENETKAVASAQI